jgi:pantothenate synthetase
MARKQGDDLFAAMPLAVPTHASMGMAAASADRNRELTRAEKKGTDEFYKQLQVIEQQRRKTHEAQRALASLRYSALQSFTEMSESIWALKTAPGRDPALQVYVDHFSDQNIRVGGTSIHEVTNIGSERIIDEVGRSLYFPTEEERRGFFAWLRGKSK